MSSACFQSHVTGEIGRILCVADPAAHRLVVAALARPGWSVECVRETQHAIDRAMSDPASFDILVTEHALPALDAADLVRRLRASGFSGEAIVLTTGATRAEAVCFRKLGVGIVLLKPVDARRLRSAADSTFCAAVLQTAATTAARARADRGSVEALPIL